MSPESAHPSWLGPVTIILLIITYLILLPTALRFMKSAWTIRFEMYMQARKVHITLICGVALLIIIIVHPILLCLYFWSDSNNDIVETFLHIVVIVLSIVPLACVALRLWLFYYSYKYTEAIFKERRIGLQMEKTEELKALTPAGNRQSVSPFVSTPKTMNMDQAYANIDLNQLNNIKSKTEEEIIKMASTLVNPLQFWIDYRRKLGSLRSCLLIAVIVFVFDICIISISVFSIAYYIQSAIYIVVLLFIQFHVYRLSPFRDEFFVRKQFVTELKILYLNLMLWITYLCIAYFTVDNDDMYIPIIIRFLLDGNMILTAFFLILVEFAIPLFRFQEGMDTLSNRNVLIESKLNNNKKLKIALFECITHRDGYYLFMEHLMKEFCVENLLFITEVGYMKHKFESSVIVPRSTAYSSSMGKTIKTALSQISERVVSSRESSVSKSSDNHRIHKQRISPSPKQIIAKLSDIPSNDVVEQDKNETTMGVINGKQITIPLSIITNKAPNLSIMDKKRQSNMSLPRLPHTLTLAASMQQNNLFDSVDMIYDNFIQRGAQYQINLSAATRQDIAKIVTQHRVSVEAQREKLLSKGLDQGGVIPTGLSGIIVDVHIFDDACSEILALLRSSYYRFSRTKQYKIYCSAMAK